MAKKTPRDANNDALFADFGVDSPSERGSDIPEERERSVSFDEDYMTPDAKRPGKTGPDDRKTASGDDEEDWLAALQDDDPGRSRGDEVMDSLKTFGQRAGVTLLYGAWTAGGKIAQANRAAKASRQRKKAERKAQQEALATPPQVLREAPTVGRNLRGDQMLVYDSELDEIDYTDDEDLPEMRDYMPIRFRRYGRIGIGGGIMYGLFVISVSIILACVGWMCASDVLALNKDVVEKIVTIDDYEPTGDMPTVTEIDDKEVEIKVDIDQVATALKNAGIIEYKWLFKLFSQFSHANTKMDPGTYVVSTELDYRALVTKMQFGSENQETTEVTFPEGWSMAQIFRLLEESNVCKQKDLYEAAANYDFDYDFLDGVPLGDASRLEGYLFPDTYEFFQGEAAQVTLNRFLNNTQNRLTEEMYEQAENRGRSMREIIIIASLIEKEAGSFEEMPTMAGAIYNRLGVDMPLQIDATINYIKGTSTLDISIADTEIDDPYNTYKYEGLPPGPISNPGMASIKAALEPESNNYWYWYAVDGKTSFFTDYEDQQAFIRSH